VLVEGETTNSSARELWAGIVECETAKSVQIKFIRQVISELYSETSDLNLSHDSIYFTPYEAKVFVKEWRVSTLPKESLLYVGTKTDHLIEANVGQCATTVFKWLK